jgi:nitroreductase
MITALTPELFTAAVDAAIRAPSMHNSQPWRFRHQMDTIEVLADPARRLPAADPAGWAGRMACGAAIFNLRVALAARGAPVRVDLLPDSHQPLLLARLTPLSPRPATPAERSLCAAIPQRHSNRYPFLNTAVPIDVRADLVHAARAEGAWFDVLAGPAPVEAVAAIIQAANDRLNHDAAYVAEVAAWTRGDHPEHLDGVSRAAGGPAPEPTELIARRAFSTRATTKTFEQEPLLAVLGSYGDTPADQLTAGQALQHVLLTATSRGLAASMISQPIEVPERREELRRALSRRGAVQMILRIGYAAPAPPSPRRPVADVVDP